MLAISGDNILHRSGKAYGGRQMIFEDIAEVMSEKPVYKMARKTGLSRDKVNRMAQGIPFILDYNVVFALGRLGYHLELVENQIRTKPQ